MRAKDCVCVLLGGAAANSRCQAAVRLGRCKPTSDQECHHAAPDKDGHGVRIQSGCLEGGLQTLWVCTAAVSSRGILIHANLTGPFLPRKCAILP